MGILSSRLRCDERRRRKTRLSVPFPFHGSFYFVFLAMERERKDKKTAEGWAGLRLDQKRTDFGPDTQRKRNNERKNGPFVFCFFSFLFLCGAQNLIFDPAAGFYLPDRHKELV